MYSIYSLHFAIIFSYVGDSDNIFILLREIVLAIATGFQIESVGRDLISS